MECCCATYGYDPPDVFDESTVRAAKPHTCCECGDPIHKGTPYVRSKGLWDGRWDTFHTCVPCSRIRESMCNPPFGMLVETVWDCLGMNYVDGHMLDCPEPVRVESPAPDWERP